MRPAYNLKLRLRIFAGMLPLMFLPMVGLVWGALYWKGPEWGLLLFGSVGYSIFLRVMRKEIRASKAAQGLSFLAQLVLNLINVLSPNTQFYPCLLLLALVWVLGWVMVWPALKQRDQEFQAARRSEKDIRKNSSPTPTGSAPISPPIPPKWEEPWDAPPDKDPWE